jgi:L-amino acid N-acyltransferase YncA
MAATNDTPFRIRPAAKKDRASLRRLFAYTGMVGTDECDWKIVLDRKEGYEVLVAEERDEAVCGYALCQSKWEGKIHLQDLVVDANFV